MAISTKPIWEAAPMDSKLQFAISLLNEKYPGLVVETLYNTPGDYTEIRFRHRGIREFKTWKVANTVLVVASPTDLIRQMENIIDGGISQEITITEGKETTGNAWVDEWAKKHEQR